MGQYPESCVCAIFDLDGTLADVGHRRHHVATRPKNWAAWNAAMGDDKPVEPIQRLLFMLHAAKYRIVICSGREVVFRENTERWLRDHLIPFDAIYMRAAKDHRDDGTVKSELLDQILADGWLPWIVFDDRSRVVDMWRERGLTCLQCAPGDF